MRVISLSQMNPGPLLTLNFASFTSLTVPVAQGAQFEGFRNASDLMRTSYGSLFSCLFGFHHQTSPPISVICAEVDVVTGGDRAALWMISHTFNRLKCPVGALTRSIWTLKGFKPINGATTMEHWRETQGEGGRDWHKVEGLTWKEPLGGLSELHAEVFLLKSPDN